MEDFNWEITKQDNSIVTGNDNLPNDIFVAKDDLEDSNRPKLMKINVYNKEYGVDLENGTFLNDNNWMQHPNPIPTTEQGLRLIFFKRIKKLIAEVPYMWPDGKGGFKEIHTTINIHIGFQTTIEGQNYKRIMVILPDGNISWLNE